ncbi:MAPEG family protein [Porticoccus litoralis]|uniref:MAPEG family protein n=1 Tax=Porticoccus litoralis TaxID=434086 RepID=A0AAW8B2U5_9GAMM|nr:MAPEG family protein [Porticoccus litoralis]MDP1519860.1 MAPEG family protein [Porticoccus litoralis]
MPSTFSMEVSAIYMALCGILLVVLALRVVRGRFSCRVGIGDGDNRELNRRIRVHGNAAEYMPMALLLLLAVENTLSSTWPVHALGSLLVVCRLLHAYGLGKSAGSSPPRFLGTAGTLTMILLSAGIVLANSF